VVFTARDASGNEATTSTHVTVVDTTAPQLALQVNRTVLWPPNHKMVDIAISVTASDGCSAVSLSAAVSSSEPARGFGKGDKSPDWTEPVIDEQNGIVRLQLRAERAGAGNGRVYRVTIVATDQSGNSTSRAVDIMVPHDRRR
jgi:hypothetical protein